MFKNVIKYISFYTLFYHNEQFNRKKNDKIVPELSYWSVHFSRKVDELKKNKRQNLQVI